MTFGIDFTSPLATLHLSRPWATPIRAKVSRPNDREQKRFLFLFDAKLLPFAGFAVLRARARNRSDFVLDIVSCFSARVSMMGRTKAPAGACS